MEWLYSLFIEHSALQAVVVLSLISAIGLGLGKIHVCGISLGVTFVFFAGILAEHFGLSIDPQMLNYAESFGLIIFVYALGLQVGPGFFSSFRKGGVTLNMLAIAVVILGTLLTVVCSYTTEVSLPNMVGILCGATTNTPALGAAQQTLKQMGLESSTPALGCAVAYPLGVIGVILAVLLIRKLLVRREDLEVKEKDDANKTYIAAFQVHNPAIFDKSIKDIAHMSYPKFVISRLWRDGNVSIPTSEKIIKEGDRLTVVGEAAAIQNVEKVLGNAVKSLKEPNLVAVFVGIILGLALGAVPFSIPGISTPIRLGLAGGPIIVGILIGTFGPRLHMITYTTRSANLMLRALGLSLYLACLGLDAGAHFFDTVFRPEGLLWIGLGFGLTVVPTVLVGFFAFKIMKIDFGSVSGMLCGSMANPMALNYANDTIPGDNPSVAYATVYPLSMFLRVIIAQVLLMFLL